jgi:hypothetical protein
VRPKNVFSIISAVSVFVIATHAVGQKKSGSKFERYLQPASISAMDFAVLRANVDLKRSGSGALTYVGEPTPTVSFNPDRNEIAATVFVDGIGKEPLDKARSQITFIAKDALHALRRYVPELQEGDFVLEVDWFKSDPVTVSGRLEVFAEYRNGKIVFK